MVKKLISIRIDERVMEEIEKLHFDRRGTKTDIIETLLENALRDLKRKRLL